MVKRLFYVSLIVSFVFVGCKSDKETDSGHEYSVWLLSYGNYPESQLQNLQRDIQNCFDTLIPEITVNVNILGSKPIPDNCWNDKRVRLRADSIIRYQKELLTDKEMYIQGVTSKDISVTAHGISDWGIQGLSYCPGHSSVISTFRVSNKKLLYKVAVHELLHCFGLHHCGNKDRSCYICDADKRPQLEKQTRLCPDCKEKLLHHSK